MSVYGVQLPVQINTRRMNRPRLDITYPVITGLENPSAQERINTAIMNVLNTMIREQGYYENPKTDLDGSFEIKTNEKGILSLSLILDAYAGGAHGLRLIRSLTMDIQTGNILTLEQLFKPGVDYVQILSDIVQRKIKERNIYLLGEFNRIRPDQDFYIADKSLVLYFQLYEITPYAFGFPYFPISVYELQPYLNEKGPLARMLY